MARHATLVFLTLLILLAVPMSSGCIENSTPTITLIENYSSTTLPTESSTFLTSSSEIAIPSGAIKVHVINGIDLDTTCA